MLAGSFSWVLVACALRAERVIHRHALSKTSLNAGLFSLRNNNFGSDVCRPSVLHC
ncbi:hypothetical protein [Pseudomonas brassicacearum]|uniref:hypothetical protein n=1 Tax=Pseudomonas brassicacearum TaxID=930166 RepID=UPI00160CCE2E|nr:hypothetical protein [Pseudomonas brassicacearum]